MARESGSEGHPQPLGQHDDAAFVREMPPAKLLDHNQEIVARLSLERRPAHALAPTPDDLKILHQNLFQGLYAEPGNFRGIRTGPEAEDATTETGRKIARQISGRVDALFETLKQQNHLRLPKEEFVVQLANFIHGVDKLQPFYYGNRLVTQVMAGHIADFAGYRLDLLTVNAGKLREAMDAAQHHQDYVPLRAILRDNSRPMRAIMFEQAINSGELPNITVNPDLKHAYGLVVQAMGRRMGKGPMSEFALRSVDKEVIRKIQTELDAGRLTTKPSGEERAWFLGRTRGPTR